MVLGVEPIGGDWVIRLETLMHGVSVLIRNNPGSFLTAIETTRSQLSAKQMSPHQKQSSCVLILTTSSQNSQKYKYLFKPPTVRCSVNSFWNVACRIFLPQNVAHIDAHWLWLLTQNCLEQALTASCAQMCSHPTFGRAYIPFVQWNLCAVPSMYLVWEAPSSLSI